MPKILNFIIFQETQKCEKTCKRMKILELEKLENYKHNSSILENFCFLVRYKNYEIQKILVEEVLKLDIPGKYYYLSKILIHLNENSSYETIRFILYHSLFDGNFIHIGEWFNIISRVYHYDVKLRKPNLHKMEPIPVCSMEKYR